MPEKVTVLSLIEVIKDWKFFDSGFIKDSRGVITSASKEKGKKKRKTDAEKKKEQEKK